MIRRITLASYASFLLCAAASGPAPASAAAAQDPDLFEKRVRPILAEHCYGCHSEKKGKRKGGLVLDSEAGWLKGGSLGPAITPGDSAASRVVRAIRYEDEDLQMPPDSRLPAAAVAILEDWIRRGAPASGQAAAGPDAARIEAIVPPDIETGRKHFAFTPVVRPAPPTVSTSSWTRTPIDRFLLARLEQARLSPAPEAARRTLIRRATFDLIGLPPTPAEIEAFVNDPAADAWEKVIERLLSSPHYGERWARAWLDVVRYADSNGLDENLAFADAFRYRDYVIRAFNEDKPYDRFVIEQLAGDLLPIPHDRARYVDQLTATAFLALGPKVLAEPDREKLLIDIVDEQIDVMGKTFMGLTLGCARCHDHKFDPVPTADYYKLAGIFKSTEMLGNLGEVLKSWIEVDLATGAEKARMKAWQAEFEKVEAPYLEMRTAADRGAMNQVRAQSAAYLLTGSRAASVSHAFEAETFTRGNLGVDKRRWGSPDTVIVHTIRPGVQFAEYSVTLPQAGRYLLEVRYASKEARPMRVVLNGRASKQLVMSAATDGDMPEHQKWFRAGDFELQSGSNLIRIERDTSVPHLDKLRLVPSAGDADRWPMVGGHARGLNPDVVRAWIERFEAPDPDPLRAVWKSFAELPAGEFAARSDAVAAGLRTRRTAGDLKLPAMAAGLIEGLAPSSLQELAGRYQTLLTLVGDAIERKQEELARKKKANPDVDVEFKLDDPEMEKLRVALLGKRNGPFVLPRSVMETLYAKDERARIARIEKEVRAIEKRKPAAFEQIISVREGKPVDLPVHIRGNHISLAPTVEPRGFLQVTGHCVTPPPIPAGSSGRLQLARWLTHPGHPLTARVMVNRIWQGHFGEGLVRTPSNFGLRGQLPSHPELLDWLADEFQKRKWSVKAMHRLILQSAAYRMAGAAPPIAGRAMELDPENRLLSYFPRRRLDAESIRDAMLFVSGRLDRKMGGSLLETRNRQYVADDQSVSTARYESPRRSLYMPIIRSDMFPFFSAFDYADASVPIDKRPGAVVPHQALLLMNSPFALEQSAHFAARCRTMSGKDPSSRIRAAYRNAFGREPAPEEIARASLFLAHARELAAADPAPEPDTMAEAHWRQVIAGPKETAWQALMQVLFASNEFLYLD